MAQSQSVKAAQKRYRDKHRTELRAKWRKKPYDERKRAWNLKSRLKLQYGITVEQYQQMLVAQGGRCAICRLESDAMLHVDHSHATGKVRGLLCGACNLSLGGFRDDPATLLRAAIYLRRSR